MAIDTTPMDFPDLERVLIPVKLGKKNYVLAEASEDAAVKYNNASMKATKFNEEGKAVSVDGVADVEPLLVSMCLFEADDQGKPQYDKEGNLIGAVALGFVRSLPARIVKPLFERAQAISGLSQKTKTVMDIDKEIAKLYKQRNELSEAQAKGGAGVSDPKEQPKGMPTTSA